MNLIWSDFPKIECPLIRERGKVTNQINPGYEWVFNRSGDIEISEKIDGTNVSLVIRNRELVAYTNRTNFYPATFFDKSHLAEGIRNAFEKGYVPLTDGQHFGEVMGPKVSGGDNFLGLDRHIWIPFSYLRRYFAFDPRDLPGEMNSPLDPVRELTIDSFQKLSFIMQGLESRVKAHWCNGAEDFAEGIVIRNTDPLADPDTAMCKIRRDMFDWFEKKKKGAK